MLAHYQPGWLHSDLGAGLVLTTMLVPVGIAYAQASGIPGIYGLYATIIPLLAYALFGPSRILVLGPDSALAPLIAAVVVPLAAGSGERAIALGSTMALIAGLLFDDIEADHLVSLGLKTDSVDAGSSASHRAHIILAEAQCAAAPRDNDEVFATSGQARPVERITLVQTHRDKTYRSDIGENVEFHAFDAPAAREQRNILCALKVGHD